MISRPPPQGCCAATLSQKRELYRKAVAVLIKQNKQGTRDKTEQGSQRLCECESPRTRTLLPEKERNCASASPRV